MSLERLSLDGVHSALSLLVETGLVQRLGATYRLTDEGRRASTPEHEKRACGCPADGCLGHATPEPENNHLSKEDA